MLFRSAGAGADGLGSGGGSGMTARIAIVIVSDRASRGEYEDKGGPAAETWLRRVITSPMEIARVIIPDGRVSVAETLRRLRRPSECMIGSTDHNTIEKVVEKVGSLVRHDDNNSNNQKKKRNNEEK